MEIKLLSQRDMEIIDALKESYGGSKYISKKIEEMRDYETRKKILNEKGFYEMIKTSEELVKKFPKVSDFEKSNNIVYKDNLGIGTTQVSGFQGEKVTFHCIKKIASKEDGFVFIPAEMISVTPLTEHYVYNGGLLATLTMAENIMKSKFCNTNLIGVPLKEERFKYIEKVTGKKIPIISLGNGMAQVKLVNQGTFFGNFGGIEVSNDNHLVYLDGITRCALTTGGNFYLNPSWSTIVSSCYYAYDLPIQFKISMLLSTQNLIQFRMLLNIMKEYIRSDMTTPIYEINIGNACTPETFIQCYKELHESGIKGVSLAAHILINPDLGREDFNWLSCAQYVLENGVNITIKYESDGTRRPMDTMEAYFLSDEERDKNAEIIGDVIYYKTLRCTQHSIDLMKKGIKINFAKVSY